MELMEVRRQLLHPRLLTVSGQTAYLIANISAPLKQCKTDLPYASGGWNGASITRCGKNLFDINASTTIDNRLIDGSGNLTTNSNYKTTDYLPIQSGVYRVSFDGNAQISGNAFRICVFNLSKVCVGEGYVNVDVPNAHVSSAFTVQDDGYIRIGYRKNQTNIMVEHGGTETGYEPYSGVVYVANWSNEVGTIYGGSFDLVSGKLVSKYTSGGSQLPTPTEYHITPQRVTVEKGINNISSSGGAITVTYYM